MVLKDGMMFKGGVMMHIKSVSFVVVFFSMLSMPVYAGFDDILKEVFLETSRPIGTQEYVFSPGDEVIKKVSYSAHYSGIEVSQNIYTLLFTVFEGEKKYVIKFPNPDVIQIKDVKIKVISYDNTSLRIQLIPVQPTRY